MLLTKPLPLPISGLYLDEALVSRVLMLLFFFFFFLFVLGLGFSVLFERPHTRPHTGTFLVSCCCYIYSVLITTIYI